MKKLLMLFVVTLLLSSPAYAKKHKIKMTSYNTFDLLHILDDVKDEEVPIAGELIYPNNDKDTKVPALIYIHGSGGKAAKNMQWIKLFRKMGYATFRIDSFKGRKTQNEVGSHIKATMPMLIADAYVALNYLSTDPRIDTTRIGVMGNSKGGAVALYSAWDKIQEKLSTGNKFAFHVALYPVMYNVMPDEMVLASNILILAGEKDDWTPSAPADMLAERFSNIESHRYPGAYHAFDADYMKRNISNGYSLKSCKSVEITMTGETFINGISMATPAGKTKAVRSCATKGATAGRNGKAKKQAVIDLKAFINRI